MNLVRRCAAVVFVVTICCVAVPALAQNNVFTNSPEPQNTSNHPLSIDVGVGVTDWFHNINQGNFKTVQELYYHFSGTDEGFHIGVTLGEAFSDNWFLFDALFRAGYDLKFSLSSNLWFGINPFLGLGFGFISPPGNSTAAFCIQPGAEAKLYFGDMWYVFVRPLEFTIYAINGGGATYDFLGGGGIRL